ncbi:sugar phosphate nucleotidyltransferase [Amylibacter sp.]|nr:sugar phosphate nucleotidyltransferase [Amylibacter sp.]MDC3304381.1 sugar phosphate nucleotidyltransferase [Amylibacter sp.]
MFIIPYKLFIISCYSENRNQILPKILKAVFPLAGFGTRFLRATKAMPNERLPIIDKPLIQYGVEEAIAAGIDTLIFITGRNKRVIEDRFDGNNELESALRLKGKYVMVMVL